MTRTRAKVNLIAPDRVIEFTNANIYSANLVEEYSPVSVELPISKLSFSAIITEEFSMFSETNILTERMPLMAYELLGSDWIFLGRYYLETWKNNSDQEIEFVVVDLIGLMHYTEFDGIFFASATTLQSALDQILLPASIPYEVNVDVKDELISGWIPPGTYRSALQQVLFAAGASVTTSRSEKLIIQKIDLPGTGYDYIVNKDNIGAKPEIELLPLVSEIELVAHNYSQSTEIETIFSETLPAGSHKIIFEKPYYSIVITGPGYVQSVLATENGDYIGTENGDYIEVGGEFVFGPNSVYLTLQEEALITITGYPWIDSKRVYIFTETQATSTYKNSLSIRDATMINNSNAQARLDTLRDFYRQRYKQIIKFFPRLSQPGDKVVTETLYNKFILTNVKKIDTSLTGGFLLNCELLGVQSGYNPDLRFARTGIATAGTGMNRNNKWRNYA